MTHLQLFLLQILPLIFFFCDPSATFFVLLTNWIGALLILFLGGATICDGEEIEEGGQTLF